jgi:hypothetical protein
MVMEKPMVYIVDVCELKHGIAYDMALQMALSWILHGIFFFLLACDIYIPFMVEVQVLNKLYKYQ